jgi:hypothetical protein
LTGQFSMHMGDIIRGPERQIQINRY